MAKASPLVSERKQPETFCLSLGLRRSRSTWLLSKGTPGREEAQDLVAVLAQSPNEVAGRGLFDTLAGARTVGTGRIAGFGFGFGFGFGEDGVVAGPQVLDVAGGQRLKVLGLADQGIGLAQQRDHIGCPRLAWRPLSDRG